MTVNLFLGSEPRCSCAQKSSENTTEVISILLVGVALNLLSLPPPRTLKQALTQSSPGLTYIYEIKMSLLCCSFYWAFNVPHTTTQQNIKNASYHLIYLYNDTDTTIEFQSCTICAKTAQCQISMHYYDNYTTREFDSCEKVAQCQMQMHCSTDSATSLGLFV